MHRPVWLIESGIYGNEIEELAVEIRRQRMECRFVTYREIVKGPPPLPPGRCCIVYGSYPTVRHAILHRGWHPGGWCNPDTLECTAYYSHFQRYLLNQRHQVISGVDAIRERRRLFAEFAKEGAVFVRPTSLHKLFVGRLIQEDDFEVALAPTRYDSETRIVIASPREIGSSGDEIVAASHYAECGVRSISRDCPAEVIAYAQGMLADIRWRPDDLFMLDVAEADSELCLVEMNSFSCSWLYECNFAKVVSVASEVAGRSRQAVENH